MFIDADADVEEYELMFDRLDKEFRPRRSLAKLKIKGKDVNPLGARCLNSGGVTGIFCSSIISMSAIFKVELLYLFQSRSTQGC